MNTLNRNIRETQIFSKTLFNWFFDTQTSLLEISDNIDSSLINNQINIRKEGCDFFYDSELTNFTKQCNLLNSNTTHPINGSLRVKNSVFPNLCMNLSGYINAPHKIEGVGILYINEQHDTAQAIRTTPLISPDKIPVMICITDALGNIQYINETLSQTTGYSSEELYQQHMRVFSSGVHHKTFYKKMWSILKSGKTWEGKILNKAKDGSLFWEKATIRPYYNTEGKNIGYIKSAENITQQVYTQKLLKEERNLFLSGPVIIFKWKLINTWSITYVSPNIKDVLGHPTETLVSGQLHFKDLLHPSDYQRIINQFNNNQNKPEGYHYTQQYQLKARCGEYKHFNAYITIEKDNINNTSYANGYLLETTKFMSTQKSLQENEIKYRDVFQTAGVGIIYTNKQGEILDTNKKFDELVNVQPGELKGCLAMDLINSKLPKSNSKKFLPILFHILKGNKIEPIEIEIGNRFYEIQFNYNSQLERNIGILRDISDKKLAEKKTQQSEKKHKYLIDNMTEGLVLTDKDETLTFLNDAAKNILEVNEATDIKSIRDIATQTSIDIIFQQEKLRKTGAASEYFIEIITKNNNRKQLEIKAKPIIDEANNYKGSFGLIRDITEQYKAELNLKSAYSQLKTTNKKLQQHTEELEIAKKLAEESEQLKSAFLANISHEIRTPMNGIVGFAQLCMNSALSEKKRDNYLKIISDSTLQLEAVVMNIIDLSKIESNETKLNYQTFNLSENLQHLYDEIFENAAEKKLNIKWLISNHIQIYSDPNRFKQIVKILIDNAIKFTNEGTISIKASVDDANLTIAIEDSGIGIPNDMHAAIFEPFRQVEMAMKRRFGGTGLGLSIARKLAHMMDGEILLESSIGQGSTFYFIHPYTKI